MDPRGASTIKVCAKQARNVPGSRFNYSRSTQYTRGTVIAPRLACSLTDPFRHLTSPAIVFLPEK